MVTRVARRCSTYSYLFGGLLRTLGSNVGPRFGHCRGVRVQRNAMQDEAGQGTNSLIGSSREK